MKRFCCKTRYYCDAFCCDVVTVENFIFNQNQLKSLLVLTKVITNKVYKKNFKNIIETCSNLIN